VLATQPLWVQRLAKLHLLTPTRVAVGILVAVVLTFVVRRVIKRVLKRVLDLPGSDRGRAEARQGAVASALRGALVGVIWSVATIFIIGEVGINIGAFVATATVVGGAVAFGAQTMVRDMIAGLFVLAEDQYGVGDEVDLGLASGTVERITLRSVRLRDGFGTAWYVPHGGVARVGNLSKSNVTRLDVEVSRRMPMATAEAAIEALCTALTELPEMGDLILGAPRLAGVASIGDERVVFHITVASRPGTQDQVTARWRRLTLDAFEAGSLQAPAKHQREAD
jgi:small conductance mechanosensitive channel